VDEAAAISSCGRERSVRQDDSYSGQGDSSLPELAPDACLVTQLPPGQRAKSVGDGVTRLDKSFDDLPVLLDSKPVGVSVLLLAPGAGSPDGSVLPYVVD